MRNQQKRRQEFKDFSLRSSFCEKKFQYSLNNLKCSFLNLQNKDISNHINFDKTTNKE